MDKLQRQNKIRRLSRIYKLSRLLVEIDELKRQHLKLERKSFKFKLIKDSYLIKRDNRFKVEVDGGSFSGRLIVPPQDYDLFNVGCVSYRPGAGPEHKFLPLFYGHKNRILIGAIQLKFVYLPLPAGTLSPSAKTYDEIRKHRERYEWQARIELVFAAQKAKEIYDSIAQRGQSAIKELSVGYRVEESTRKPCFADSGNEPKTVKKTYIYEISIEGVKKETTK